MAGKARNKAAAYAEMPTREAVLRIAEELCAEHGPEGVRLQVIAERLGVRPPSLYSHFDGLDAILGTLAERGLNAAIASYDGLDLLPPDRALREQISREVRLFAARPGLARLLLADLASPGGRGEFSRNVEIIQRSFALETALLERGVAAGIFRPVEPRMFIAAKLGTILHKLAFEWFSGPVIEEQRIEELCEIVSDWVLRALRA